MVLPKSNFRSILREITRVGTAHAVADDLTHAIVVDHISAATEQQRSARGNYSVGAALTADGGNYFRSATS